MDEYISRKAAIAYIREQSEECQKAFEELGGESGIYADAYNDLAEDFYSIPSASILLTRRLTVTVFSSATSAIWRLHRMIFAATANERMVKVDVDKIA